MRTRARSTATASMTWAVIRLSTVCSPPDSCTGPEAKKNLLAQRKEVIYYLESSSPQLPLVASPD
jgi:hypothetical protein